MGLLKPKERDVLAPVKVTVRRRTNTWSRRAGRAVEKEVTGSLGNLWRDDDYRGMMIALVVLGALFGVVMLIG